MDQWLDSLSEDWVSQPRSPHSSPLLRGSISRDEPSPKSDSTQSRIPRYKPRSSSALSTASDKESKRLSSLRRDSHAGSALREKSLSNINASKKPNEQGKTQTPVPRARKLGGRQASTGSVTATEQDTVAHKPSPRKDCNTHATPEWKRRVLKENAGGDLFGPTSLESVFKPPTVNKSQIKPARTQNMPTKQKELSSPPPFPPRTSSPSTNVVCKAAAASSAQEDPQRAFPNPQILEQDLGTPSRESQRKENCITDDHISNTPVDTPKSNSAGSHMSPHSSHRDRESVHESSRISPSPVEVSRDFSDKSQNEKISPFLVSRQDTVDGRIEFAAVDLSMRRLRSQMDKMRLQQQNVPSSRSSDHEIDHAEPRPKESSIFRAQMDEVTCQSLPDDLSMGTDAYAANGGFVSIRRGGYSNDGSFQRRPLSPSLLPDVGEPSLKLSSPINIEPAPISELHQNFAQTKSRTPSSPPPASAPATPIYQRHERTSSDDRPGSSGSPLKLFDKYDTFTNERLVRRMSKFEETLQYDSRDNNEADDHYEQPSPSPRRRRPYVQNQTHPITQSVNSHRISSFGEGELNEHQFPPYPDASNIYRPLTRAQDGDGAQEDVRGLIGGLRSDLTDAHRPDMISRSEKDSRNTRPQDQSDSLNIDEPQGKEANESDCRINQDQRDALRTVTGKRLPYSPVKNPAPKRRRTLIIPEETEQAHLDPQEFATSKTISGRKRKDARYDSSCQVADPSTLALREMRQPRVPTVGHRNKSKGNPSILRDVKAKINNSAQFEKSDSQHIDPPTQIVAGALATIALNTAQEVTYGSRKASVTTADFFNEAQQIMQLIRAKGRPRSSHTTTEVSESEPQKIVEESFDEFTKDEFSRPPSRECSIHASQEPVKLDRRVISHLSKFKDDQDLGLTLSASTKTLKLSHSRTPSRDYGPDLQQNYDACSGAESDPPNTRIRESAVRDNKRKHSFIGDSSSLGSVQHNGSQNSQSRSGPSSGRSNPTGSSHSSTNRMIIAPETVAHLLSDQMAGMVFDKKKQLWVKRKSSPNIGLDQQDHTVSEGTEEDLFGDIPDLSVNEMEELQRVKDAVSSVKSIGSATNKVSIRDQAIFHESQVNIMHQREQMQSSRPRTAEGKSIPNIDDSSAPSKFSHFASSGPQPGTRATSRGDEALSVKETHPSIKAPERVLGNGHIESEEQVEHEISIFEGRETHTPTARANRNHQARVVTVAFSSPLVEHRDLEFEVDRDSDFDEGENELNLKESPVHRSSLSSTTKASASSAVLRNLNRPSSTRRMSFGNRSGLGRPMSRLDEEEELSIVRCSFSDRRVSMEVAMTTPLPISRSLMIPPTTDGKSSNGFQLSPLPDFTVNQMDKPIDGISNQVAKRLPRSESDNGLSLAARDLVKNLTDLEPYEPYWDFIRSVDLHERGLSTLHMLDEFCGRVEEIDVSNNQIRELNGIPRTTRHLNISSNHLSDLTAWDFLHNLQYLDVSDNQLSSVRGFQQLFHLRALRLDGNNIGSLSGLEDLNGLTYLSMRGNELRSVDFDKFEL